MFSQTTIIRNDDLIVKYAILLPLSDLPHDTDFPYVIRIIDDLRVIRPYHILIRNYFKYTENPYTAHKTDNRRLKINLRRPRQKNIHFWRTLAEPGSICIVQQMAHVYFGIGDQ